MIATAQPRGHYSEDTASATSTSSDYVITVYSSSYYDPLPDPVETFKRGVREAKLWKLFLEQLSGPPVRDCAIGPQLPSRTHHNPLIPNTPIRGPP